MKRWDNKELLKAKQLLDEGKSYEEIGKILNRSSSSIRNKLYKNYDIKNYKCRFLSNETKAKISKSLGGTGKIEKAYCLNCNKLLKRSTGKYCNQTCQAEYKRVYIINEWLVGNLSGTVKGGSLQLLTAVREWVFDRANYECEECGNNNVNPYTKLSILQVDHIDGDASNCRPENLRILCPNCHAMTPTFGNRNKNSARSKYRKETRPY